MAKYNIDDILSELGVADANKQANAPARACGVCVAVVASKSAR